MICTLRILFLDIQVQYIAGVAKLRLASRMWHFEPLHAAL